MTIPKEGAVVRCPADREDPPYMGRITHVGETVHSNAAGVLYRWISVRRQGARDVAVWPSHRLGFKEIPQ